MIQQYHCNSSSIAVKPTLLILQMTWRMVVILRHARNTFYVLYYDSFQTDFQNLFTNFNDHHAII
ncbi:hypothetical protein FH630_04930 [Lactiplantibacillus plantarum]|nr:hypothetical protein [Lactiplantibacillus plantarum]